MDNNLIELNFLSLFALITFFIFFTVKKYSYKIKKGILLDQDFLKPQAFHKEPVSRSGGIASIFSLMLFFVIYYLLYSEIMYEYIFICTSLFLIGYLDDIKIKINPNARLLLMIIFLIFFINILPIKISNIDLIYLTTFL